VLVIEPANQAAPFDAGKVHCDRFLLIHAVGAIGKIDLCLPYQRRFVVVALLRIGRDSPFRSQLQRLAEADRDGQIGYAGFGGQDGLIGAAG